MAETTARELKLIQYLNEAYGKEKQLEPELQRLIALMEKTQIKQRLREHLKETKAQARGLEKRIKQLGGKAETVDIPGPDAAAGAAAKVASVANKAVAAAKGPIATLRGTSPADNQLRNLRDAFWNEAEEIAHYDIIEALANELSDRDTAKLAKEFRRQEERMQKFIEKQIPQLVKSVVKSEIPAKERKPAASTNGRAASSRSTTRRASSTSGTRRKAASTSRASSSSSRKPATARKASTTRKASTARKPASTRKASGSSSSRSRSTGGSSSGGSSSS